MRHKTIHIHTYHDRTQFNAISLYDMLHFIHIIIIFCIIYTYSNRVAVTRVYTAQHAEQYDLSYNVII